MALQQDVNLFEYAWRKRIIIVGPTNLLATLKAVESVWRQDKQERNALKIAEQGGLLYDKFVGLISDLEEVNKHIEKTSGAYNAAMNKLSTGRGNLVGQVEKMKALGAKAKKSLPAHYLDKTNTADELVGH